MQKFLIAPAQDDRRNARLRGILDPGNKSTFGGSSVISGTGGHQKRWKTEVSGNKAGGTPKCTNNTRTIGSN